MDLEIQSSPAEGEACVGLAEAGGGNTLEEWGLAGVDEVEESRLDPRREVPQSSGWCSAGQQAWPLQRCHSAHWVFPAACQAECGLDGFPRNVIKM